MDLQNILMIIGFSLAAYSIVANDAIQTLGTFLASNSHRPWWVLWLFAMSILSAVLVYGWYTYGGDASYGRLSKFPPPDAFMWIYLLPPVFVLLITRFGVPVSTTFLVLTVFVTANLEKMLRIICLSFITPSKKSFRFFLLQLLYLSKNGLIYVVLELLLFSS